ncbi:hypothetical protein ACFV2Q_20860 [Streptomyces sp. NPDC059650]|uniref:hypothetical protein n=1 Tax=Streptomyces sp. NPDC059650 TaxID=3346896 RepID=UPI0036A7AA08
MSLELVGEGFRLEPLGEQHDERDPAAWGGSIAKEGGSRRPVHVGSWVRADGAALDGPLYEAVSRCLAEVWPFEPGRVVYAAR